MKIGKLPLVSVALLLVVAAKLTVKYFYPAKYVTLLPQFDGVLMGIVLVCIIYYSNIYISAWVNNRREEAADARK